jgi:hypothetical protein
MRSSGLTSERATDAACSPYWELYLHELHRCLGFEVTVHPEVPGTSTRPDFLMSNEEAALVAYSDKEARRRQREALVLDIINDIKNRDFSLSVEVLAEVRRFRAGNTSSTRSMGGSVASTGNKCDSNSKASDSMTRGGPQCPRRRSASADGGFG